MTKNSLSLLNREKKLLEATALPIITVSASFKEDLKGFYGQNENDRLRDIVFSRAHYSMALAVAVEAWGNKIDAKKAWLVDPTNHVDEKKWSSIELTDLIGKTIARFPILKTLKDLVDKFGRSKLPILDSIAPATKFLCQNIEKPILSFHIATGNILAEAGKEVVEMITDPHVRNDYVINAGRANMRFLVFDEATKREFFEVAAAEGIKIPEEQLATKVTVTGPPVDPRLIAAAKNKSPWTADRPLRIVITTGGLGTNKVEIKNILEQLLPELKKRSSALAFELMFYAGTHRDHRDMAMKLAKKYQVRYQLLSPNDPANFNPQGKMTQQGGQALLDHQSLQNKAKFRIIYHPQIIDANELLIRHAFPWADLFLSKPSGDMAYDAALCGAALLTLKEWGEWEHNVREVFEKAGIAKVADSNNLLVQLQKLSRSGQTMAEPSQITAGAQRPSPQLAQTATPAWITSAMNNTQQLPKLFYQGVKNIVVTTKKK